MTTSRARPALLAVAVAVFATVRAYQLRWTCDDAFVSFRYAENLVEGRGLVFNVGERVEGYTNFLWTLWIAPTFALGIAPETWAQIWGTAAFAGAAALLARLHRKLSPRAGVGTISLPLACVAAATHREWAVFATSGLETAAFTFFAIAAFVTLVDPSPRRGALAGLLFGLATLTRPDGIVFGVAAAVWLCGRVALADRAARSRELRTALAYGVVLGGIALAQTAFRLSYYGSVFPNTYYAKSAHLAWYRQGLLYLWYYVLRYPPVAIAPLAMAWLLASPRASAARAALIGPASLAMLLGTAHAFWVVRVGGDFMFGRFLVPSTAFFLIVLECSCLVALSVFSATPWRVRALAGCAALLIAFMPEPILPGGMNSGIVDERGYYSPERVAWMERAAARMKPVLEGTGARIAFFSTQVRFVYRTKIPIAIESETGLTDAFIAHQPLDSRRRVGHEKKASPAYLVGMRKVHIAFISHLSATAFDDYIPTVPIEISGLRMHLLHWDPTFVSVLRERGVRVPDYPAMLDAFIPSLDRMTAEAVQHEYDRAQHFYFAFVTDPVREHAFTDRLARR